MVITADKFKFKALIREISNFFYYYVLGKELRNCKTVLDVGCGHDSPLGKIEKKLYSSGIDIFKRSIIKSKKKQIHNEYIVGDIRKLDQYYKDKSFDAVIAFDVIEHLEKGRAIRLIKKMEKIAKKKVIILTPNGFYKQGPLEGNPYQIHKSGWSKEELENLGYKVYGLRGLKWLRGKHANIKYKPWLFWGFCSFVSEIIFFRFPSFSYDLFAIKTI